ncbi:hypothetical protein FAES_4446 [Fibrella aestuarina BUZ 2]|uniref:Uncharacterized protein n=1 Tax=Fibrella aestuarina BUZ 2 TaxID=1166018 RepID=I0KE92_9BACT|nr:hypothetical protein FAES_4446 [Fibrella aestuarina BUZ 2]
MFHAPPGSTGFFLNRFSQFGNVPSQRPRGHPVRSIKKPLPMAAGALERITSGYC